MRGIYTLVNTLDFEIKSDRETLQARLELFQSLDDQTCFRIVTYSKEMYRMRPSFLSTSEGESTEEFDETTWSEKTFPTDFLSVKEFQAKTLDEALHVTLAGIDELEQHLLSSD